MTRRTTILVAAFVLGAYALCAQAMLLREAQVLLFGSELSWGLVLALWLGGVAIGAQAGGWALQRSARPHLAFSVAALAMPPLLLGEIVLLRVARSLAGVGPGEYVGPGAMLLVTLAATLPVSVWVGLAFPAAAKTVAWAGPSASEKARGVGWIFLVESAGSLVGGAAFSFLLVDRVAAVPLALGGGAVLAGAVLPIFTRAIHDRRAAILPLAGLAAPIILIALGAARRLDDATVEWRWQTFARGLVLVRSEDTRYQNLAIGRLGDQYSLYTSGLVAATWPNHTDLAIEAHLAACECPSPRRILVLGGGAEGILKELLRYRPARLDYVTLDPRRLDIEWPHLDRPDKQALTALGDHVHVMDARRFVMQAARRVAAGRAAERYDLVILAAPEPASALEARLYTPEFFAAVAAILSEGGVLATSLTGTAGYWGAEPAAYVASVVRPLKRVFPEVLLTFGLPTRCYAAKRAGVLAETGEVLAARYRRAGVASPYFDPLWFAGASDLLDPAKRASVERAILGRDPPILNTDERPAAALHHMRFWLATSGAGHGGGEGAPAAQRTDFLGAILGLRLDWILMTAVGATALAALVGLVRGRRGLRRTALLWSVGTTGLATMALEIILLYTFQTLYGYVYSMVGLVVGVFMFGLVLGSLAMNRRLRGGGLIHPRGGGLIHSRGGSPTCCAAGQSPAALNPGNAALVPGGGSGKPGAGLQALAWLDLVMAIFAAGLVIVLGALRGSAADWPIQAATFALVAATGVLGGLVFPLAAAVALEDRPSTARAAGAIDAADCLGACIGGLATGVILVPVLGVSGACWVMAGAKALSALLVGSAAATSRTGSSAPLSPSA